MDKTVRGQITIVDYKDGEDAYAVFTDHDSHAVSCDPSGNPLAGELGASGKAVFLFSASRGAANLTMRYASAAGSSGVCTWTIKRAVGCTAAVVSGSNDKMSINTLTADSGYVEVSFNLEGKQTLDKRLVVVKQKKGDQGAQGKPGADGKPGTDGKQGCMLRPRGAWVAQTAYVYDAQYRDVVMVDGSWYIVRTSHTSGTQFDLSKWEEFNEFINLATSVLLAGKGYIDVMGAGRLMVYDTDKLTGWEMTAGMIRHTKTGLTLTADGKLYDPDGVHISAGGQTIKQMQNGLAGVATRVSSAEAELKVQSGLIATKVSETDFNGNTIASKINQSATTIQIEASKINLKGAVTFESMSSNMQDKVNSAVVKSEVQYALGDSATVAPVSGWSATSPVWTEGKYVWQRTAATTGTGTAYSQAVCIQGAKGSKGDQGIQGPAGKDGRTTYFHIKYSMKSAPTSAADMTETPSDYIGTYVDYTEADSTDPKKYTWSRFKGIQGATGTQGIPGKNGADGRTSYLHIKYSNDGKTFTANNGEDAGNWIGQYTDFTQADSMEFAKYKWSKIKGETGPTGSQGIPGTSSYFHVKYSPNANGNPMSDTPNIYIGTAVTTTSSAPTSYTAYKWSQFKGSKGDQGIQGPAGKDGRTTYFHIKYSMKSAPTSAADMTETPSDYIGTYVDYTEADSTDPKKYTWSRFKGIQGATGTQGVGVKAQELQYYLSTSSTTVTGGSWVSSPPAWAVGKYLWERTKVTWTNGSVSYTNAVFNKFVSDPIELARLGKTVVDGGYIKTSLINVNSLLSQNITVSNNAVITNLRAKNAVIEGMLKGVIGTFKSLSTEDGGISVSPTEFNVRDCDVSILGSVNGRNVRLSSYDIWCDDFLGFMALNYRIFNIPRAGDAYIHVSGSKGVIENMWEICGEDREPINLVYLRGNGTYRLNVCEAPIGHVIIVCNDSSNNKDIALARTPDHPYITLQSYRSVVLVANGQNNYYNSRYVSTLLPIVGFGY